MGCRCLVGNVTIQLRWAKRRNDIDHREHRPNLPKVKDERRVAMENAPDPQRETLIASLRQRYAQAERDDDADTKQALFKEAVYLGIQPQQFTETT